jgi:hypothetical protein
MPWRLSMCGAQGSTYAASVEDECVDNSAQPRNSGPARPEHPPCVRRRDSTLTYESFDHAAAADEHDNGEIWAATLWDIWHRVGKDVADRIIVESHFQLDGYTSFAKGARAILDAHRNIADEKHSARCELRSTRLTVRCRVRCRLPAPRRINDPRP